MNRYDWSRLDAGWRHSNGYITEVYVEPNGMGASRGWKVPTLELLSSYTDSLLEEDKAAVAQLAKCRIRDTEPAPNVPQYAIAERFFDDVHKLMNEPYDHGSIIAAYGAPPPPEEFVTGGTLTPNAREYVAMPGIPPEWTEPQPSQPWRRGPLAAWKLVNISCHDGRLTVVMKRGRGELIDETGPDDETLWERLSAKVMEFEKAKHTTK